MAKTRLDWFGKKVRLELDQASSKGAYAIALQVVALAKSNIQRNGQIDTGFLINSGYAVGAGGSTYSPPAREGKRAAPQETPPAGDALAGFAAEYALYQEVRLPYLQPALDQVVRDVPAKMKQYIKR